MSKRDKWKKSIHSLIELNQSKESLLSFSPKEIEN